MKTIFARLLFVLVLFSSSAQTVSAQPIMVDIPWDRVSHVQDGVGDSPLVP